MPIAADPKSFDLFLTREEVATALHVSEDTVSRFVKQGKLKAVKMGRRLLFSVEELKRLAE